MKKTLSILLAALLLLSLSACGGQNAEAPVTAPNAQADPAPVTPGDAPVTPGDAPEESAAVTLTVTIADAGALCAARESVSVTDADADGALTINDALLCAHDALYEGGAAAGYGSAMGEYGLYITRLWGNESGSYGYYVNNASAMNLAEPVREGDAVYAFSYADLSGWSDAYCWFESCELTDEGVALQLCYLAFDADWNAVVTPAAGAVVTLDGERTQTVTDAEGRALLPLPGDGEHVLSAVSDTMTLTPPAALLP